MATYKFGSTALIGPIVRRFKFGSTPAKLTLVVLVAAASLAFGQPQSRAGSFDVVGSANGVAEHGSAEHLASVNKAAVVSQTLAAVSSFEIRGKGWGHGRGMSQWGAYGYVVDHGYTAEQVLDHYYSNTTAGRVEDLTGLSDPIRVRLTSWDGRDLVVGRALGAIQITGEGGFSFSSTARYLRISLERAGSGTDVTVYEGESCSGPWAAAASTISGSVTVQGSDSAARGELLSTCSSSRETWYAGDIVTTGHGASQHTVNLVDVEEYLRGVVPNEVPASWPTAVLEAQAVAARSYALYPDFRFGSGADTCDSTRCQVYNGRFTTSGSSIRTSTHEATDRAISNTAGVVRVGADGRVAHTEFHSSSGGHTDVGSNPAVVDDGDDVASNPHHSWTVQLDPAALEQKYRLGQLVSIEVLERNGFGEWGGRVERVRYRFTGGSTEVSGSTVRLELGLKSDWFNVIGAASDPGITPGQEDLAENSRETSLVDRTDELSDDAVVRQLYRVLHRRDPNDGELHVALSALRSGDWAEHIFGLLQSSRFETAMVDELYRLALGRGADIEGRNYWLTQLGGDLRYESVGTLFFSSDEYYRLAGGTDAAFVQSLYRDLLGRQADAEGLRYWVQLLEGPRYGRDDIAFGFYRSAESRSVRVRTIIDQLRLPMPDEAEVGSYAAQLLVLDDLELAAEIAAQHYR